MNGILTTKLMSKTFIIIIEEGISQTCSIPQVFPNPYTWVPKVLLRS